MASETTRIEAFSDAVFAVAITLLALSIATFTPEHGPLLDQIAEQWTSFAAYVVSFFTIGVIWINHHSLFAHVREADRFLMVLNLVLLAVVVLIPLATATMATFLRAGGQQARIAVALYGLVLEATGIPWAVIIAWSVHRGYFHKVTSAADARTARLRSAMGAVLYLIGAGVALGNAELALGLYAAIVVYYFLVEQRAARPTPDEPAAAPPPSPHQ